jgi:capsular exopolysaccharide synthesis family protein
MAPMSRISEEFRSLQTKLLLHTNLLLSSENKGNGKVYMVVSPRHDEGRSFVIANLAVVAAEVGLKVLLLDADLRRSAQHKIFEVNDEIGLVSMLMQAKETPSGKQDMQSYIQNTRIPNLDIMVSGVGDQMLSKQVVNFDKLQGCIENIQKNLDYDIILVDTSPLLLFSESYVIAATTKATTMLLVEAGKTSLPDAQKARDQYNQMECAITGVVLNKG